MVTLCKTKYDINDKTLYNLVTEAFPIVMFAKKLEDMGEFEKHFICDDGSFIAVSYPRPIHTREDGQWEDIEASFTEQGNRLVFSDETESVSLAKSTNAAAEDGLVFLKAGDREISWTVEITESKATTLWTGNVRLRLPSASIRSNGA